jgi:signal transduction histidine kinase
MTTPAGTGAAKSLPPLFAAPPADPVDGEHWLVLVEPDQTRADPGDGLSTRRMIVVVGVLAVAVIVAVSVAGLLVSRRIAERQAVHDVAQLTDTLAKSVVQPALTDAMASDPGAAGRVLDPIVRQRLLTGSLVRVKVWTPRGTVLYSDEPRLIGQTFTLDAEARAIFTGPRIEAGVTDLRRPENRYERDRGKLLEVYRPVWTPAGDPLLFESYFRYDTVAARSHELWRGFAGIMLSSVAALVLLLIPLAWLAVARARRARDEREQLMRRALEASEDERRRIAASLHDCVVQQLAAASFTVAGHAERAANSGPADLAAGLSSAAGTIRDGIAGLRSLLVDIYPASLHTSGLEPALRDLARAASANHAAIVVSIDADAADALSPEAGEATYRVAQEAVRNALRHGAASEVRISLRDTGRVHLVVEDDGIGFDTAAALREGQDGHFGLRLMADAARSCGAGLAIWSAPGRGTRLRMSVGAA